jgi:hypothetical protein
MCTCCAHAAVVQHQHSTCVLECVTCQLSGSASACALVVRMQQVCSNSIARAYWCALRISSVATPAPVQHDHAAAQRGRLVPHHGVVPAGSSSSGSQFIKACSTLPKPKQKWLVCVLCVVRVAVGLAKTGLACAALHEGIGDTLFAGLECCSVTLHVGQLSFAGTAQHTTTCHVYDALYVWHTLCACVQPAARGTW